DFVTHAIHESGGLGAVTIASQQRPFLLDNHPRVILRGRFLFPAAGLGHPSTAPPDGWLPERCWCSARKPISPACTPQSTGEHDHPMHLIEVERKRELPDSAALRQRLIELGYREAGHLNETDVYYSRPDIDFMETVECLRV